MALDVKRIASVTLPVEVDAINDGGERCKETINIRFRPATPAQQADLKKRNQAKLKEAEAVRADVEPDPPDETDATQDVKVQLLAEFLTGWDLKDDGKDYEITPDNLTMLGYPVLNAIWSAIERYHNPNA